MLMSLFCPPISVLGLEGGFILAGVGAYLFMSRKYFGCNLCVVGGLISVVVGMIAFFSPLFDWC